MAVPRWKCCCLVLLLLVLLSAIIALIVVLTRNCPAGYLQAAVAADSLRCSQIGRDILQQGGSAVDGAIASLLCTSVINPQSSGIGGGVVFNIYDASTGKVKVIIARETAPMRMKPSLLQQCTFGPQPGAEWIAVPGELRGYEEAHKNYGRLPWKSLFEPTIKLAEEGFLVPDYLERFLDSKKFREYMRKSSVSHLFLKDGKYLKKGDYLHFLKLAETLKTVAEHGADAFYKGSLTKEMVRDVNNQGGNLTLDDFSNYEVKHAEPLNITIGNYTMYFPPPPTSGMIVGFILNILKGYKMSLKSVQEDEGKILTYHRIIEALKFGTGQIPKIRDPDFNDMTNLVSSLTSEEFAEAMRKRINDSYTQSQDYYSDSPPGRDGTGTTHVSVVDKDGNAVSATSTINHIFGSMVYSNSTGVIFNNQLADFCMLTSGTEFKISPGERPPSCISPSILISKDRRSKLVIGGAGGNKIIHATAQAIMNKLWFGYDLEKAISSPRVLVNSSFGVDYEDRIPKVVREGLAYKGHSSHSDANSPHFPSVVQGVFKGKECVHATSDRRKLGEAAGY
ncbi:glutathione hydrolase 5 proenzyme [Latimeria chalumnae]|uniref:glutathione hydrolase 5 proenzyme n=1 Tax=Latimeria chalumnae TaxID=7897 RepID=UPI00313C85B3